MEAIENKDEVILLEDSTEHLSENQAFDEIVKILNHPGLRNPTKLKSRLWLHLRTIYKHEA